MSVRIVTDSASGLPGEEASRLSITTVPLHILVDGRDMSEREIADPGFYGRLAGMSTLPTTSQPSPEQFADCFRTLLAEDDDVLAVLISAGMSGTVQAARLASDIICAERDRGRIGILDTRSNSFEEGYAVLSAAEAAQAGGSLEECRSAGEATMRRSRFLFTPHTLDYLRRGGRISGAAGLASAMLKVAPILTAKEGETGVAGITRGRHTAFDKIADLMRADVERCGLRRFAVQYVDDLEEAERFAKEVVEPVAGGPAQLVPIHPIVGLHVGPAVGVVYETEEPLR